MARGQETEVVRQIQTFVRLLRLESALAAFLLMGLAAGPAQAQDLVGTYDLYGLTRFSLTRDLPDPVNRMVITEHDGRVIRVRSPRNVTDPDKVWEGVGTVEGKTGFYSWKFADGKTGRTDFVITADNDLVGYVQISDPTRSSFNWWYLAKRRR